MSFVETSLTYHAKLYRLQGRVGRIDTSNYKSHESYESSE